MTGNRDRKVGRHPIRKGETMNDLIGIRGVADLTGLAVTTVYIYNSRGILPPPDLEVDGKPMWKPATIDKWEASRETNPATRRSSQ